MTHLIVYNFFSCIKENNQQLQTQKPTRVEMADSCTPRKSFDNESVKTAITLQCGDDISDVDSRYIENQIDALNRRNICRYGPCYARSDIEDGLHIYYVRKHHGVPFRNFNETEYVFDYDNRTRSFEYPVDNSDGVSV